VKEGGGGISFRKKVINETLEGTRLTRGGTEQQNSVQFTEGAPRNVKLHPNAFSSIPKRGGKKKGGERNVASEGGEETRG